MRRPSETRLRRAFADVLSTLLATTAGAVVVAGAAGCGGAATTTVGQTGDGGSPPTTVGWQSLCSGSPSALGYQPLLQGLHVSPEIDGAVQRSETAFLQANNPQGGPPNAHIDDDGDHWTGTTNDTVGAPCATASDPAACTAKIAGYRVLPATRAACMAAYASSPYSQTACTASYILYTRGDEIGVARTADETRALIGTFDTIGEALWATQVAPGDLRVECSSYDANPLPLSEYRQTSDGGWDLSLLDEQNCGDDTFKVVVHLDYAGNVTEVSREDLHQKPMCAMAGRRPEGLQLELQARGDAIGEHFAAMATLEAASVTAFRRLGRQLAAFGAPRELLERIRKAARDEVRHARATTALAKKYGVTPRAPRIEAPREEPTLFAIALENAREGCVRETYGALVAHLQTTRARDADVRTCMTAIADEETEHAALSWDVAAWIEAQLGDEERAQLTRARRDAFTALARELAEPVDARVARASGVPDAASAVRMLEGLGPMMLAA